MKKRLLSLLLVICMVLGMMPGSVFAVETGEPADDSVAVYFSISDDANYLTGDATGEVMALKEITVPYFDLALYGLEQFYFSSEIYGDDGDGLPGSDLEPGTAEYAEGKVTLLHLYIYALEVYHCGVDPQEAGQGYLYDQGLLGTDVLDVGGSQGSAFLNYIWGVDMNLNYYVNYEYPLASEGWGATCDQILLRDGDILTLGHFTGWSFYNDPTSIFNYIVSDNENPTQGDEITLTVYRAGSGIGNDYNTAHTVIDYCPDVFYAPVDDIPSGDVTEWEHLGTAGADGTLVVDTADLEAGEYVIAMAGQYGTDNPDEICSTPGGMILTVAKKAHTHTYENGVCTGCGEADPDWVPVTGVTLDQTEVELEVSETATLTAAVTPENATGRTVTWTSSDESVATVADGVVTAVAAGEATITAKAGSVEAGCTVTVKAAEEAGPFIYEITDTPANGDSWAKLGKGTISGESGGVVEHIWDGNNLIVLLAENTPDDAVITSSFATSGLRPTLSGTGDVTLVDGTATQTITLKSPFGSVGTWTILYTKDQAPVLAEGQNAESTGEIPVNESYGIALNGVFTDPDGDTLTYQVSVDGGTYETFEGSTLNYVPTVAGAHTLIFRANDGILNSSDTYTVTVTAKNSSVTYDVAVTVPDGVSPKFYAVNEVVDGEAVLGEQLTASADKVASFPVTSAHLKGVIPSIQISGVELVHYESQLGYMHLNETYTIQVSEADKDKLANIAVQIADSTNLSGDAATTASVQLTDGVGSCEMGPFVVNEKNLYLYINFILEEPGVTNNVTVAESRTTTVKVPENISRIAWEAEGVIGMSAPVSAGAALEIVSVTFDVTLYTGESDTAAAIEVKDSEGVTVTGTAADTYLLPALAGFTYKATASGDNAGKYNPASLTEQTPAAGGVTIPLNIKHFTVIAPKDSVVSAGTLSGSFSYSFAEAIEVKNVDDTVVYMFAPLSGNAFIRVQHPDDDAVTYWDYKSSKADGKTITITEEMLFMNDAGTEGEFNSDTVYRNFEYYSFDLGDIYMNINNQGYINLEIGDIKDLNMFRNWQAINSFTNDKIAIPDFEYEIINIEGENVISIVPDENNTGSAVLTAEGEGTAIVLVTYDAMYSEITATGTLGGAGGANRFSAIWPDRTGVFVVSVGKDGTSINSNMTCNGAVFDAEHSPQFYHGDEGASVSFIPDEGVTVTVNRSTVGKEKLSFGEFTSEGVTVDPETGEVTVSGLTTGRHIIRLEKDGVAGYQVVTATQTTVTMTDSEGNEISLDEKLEPGKTVSITVTGLTNPAEKFATKYNFNAQITYKDQNGNAYANSSGATYGKYDFSSIPQTITVTIPEDWSEDTLTLNGYIQMGGFAGDGIGSHRKVSYGENRGMAWGKDAGMHLGTLPEIVLKVNIPVEYELGDANMDGVIDTQDANLVVSYYYGSENLTEEQLKLADVDGNGVIDTQDANLIVSYYYGSITTFPAEG